MEQKHSGSGDNIAGDKHTHIYLPKEETNNKEHIEKSVITIELNQENKVLYTKEELASNAYDLIELAQAYINQSIDFEVKCIIPKNKIFQERLYYLQQEKKLSLKEKDERNRLQEYFYGKEKTLFKIGMAIKLLFIGYVKYYYPINMQNIILSFEEVLKGDETDSIIEGIRLEFWRSKNNNNSIRTSTRISEEEIPSLLERLGIIKEVKDIPYMLESVQHLPSEMIYKRVFPSICWELAHLICSSNEKFDEMLKYLNPLSWNAGLA